MTSSVRRLMEGNTLNNSPSGTLDHSPCGTHIPVKEINTLVCLPMHKTWRSPQCEGFSDIHTPEGSNSPSIQWKYKHLCHTQWANYSHVMSQPT